MTITREAFATSDDVQRATGWLGLVMTLFFASSFTTALQRVYFHAWRRPRRAGFGHLWRGLVCLLAVLAGMAILGGVARAIGDGPQIALLAIVAVAVACGLWWFSAWFLLMGDVQARVLVLTGVIIGNITSLYAASSTIWMPGNVTSNEEQFGMFGIALALIAWFSGAASCVLAGACAGSILAHEPGRIGSFIRGGQSETLTPGAARPFPPPAHHLTVRNAFASADDI